MRKCYYDPGILSLAHLSSELIAPTQGDNRQAGYQFYICTWIRTERASRQSRCCRTIPHVREVRPGTVTPSGAPDSVHRSHSAPRIGHHLAARDDCEMGRVQVPPRTPKPGKFPAKQTPLEHAARPSAGQAAPAPPRGEAAMTAPLIAPLIPPRARPGAREHGKAGHGPPPAYGRGAGGPGGPR